MYEDGEGVPKDFSEAAKWYRKAADQGDAAAQLSLAKMYALGNGVPKDVSESISLVRKAAEQGYAEAEVRLGLLNRNGEGMPQDFGEAVRWYHKAADQADASGEFSWEHRTFWVKECPRIQARRQSGTARPPTKGTSRHSSFWAWRTTTLWVCPKT